MENQDKGDFLDWETRDESFPLIKHIIAGSSAGIMEHIGMYPLDTVKVSSSRRCLMMTKCIDSYAGELEETFCLQDC